MDAWRKRYNKYIPMADDLQNILIRQLMSLKRVQGSDKDNLFDEIERIRELYIKAGCESDPMSENLIKAAMMQHLPDKVVQVLVIELKRVESTEEMYITINTYAFDHRTGLLRGQTGPMLYLTGTQTDNNESPGGQREDILDSKSSEMKEHNAKT